QGPAGPQTNPPAPSSDPEIQAMQRVAPQYRALIAKLSNRGSADGWAMLGEGWDAIPSSTPADLNSALQRLHDSLYAYYVNRQRDLAEYNRNVQIREGLKQRLAALSQGADERNEAIAGLRGQIQDVESRLDLQQRAAQQLALQTQALQNQTAALQDETVGWINATLPRSVVDTSAWGRWRPDSAAAVVGGGLQPPTAMFAVVADQPQAGPAAPASPDAWAPPLVPPDPAPSLPDGLDARMAADAAMADKARDARLAADAVGADVRDAAESEVSDLETQLGQAYRMQANGDPVENDLQAQWTKDIDILDQLRDDSGASAQVYAATLVSDWVWDNAKTETIEAIKREVLRYMVTAGSGQSPLDIDETEVRDAYEHGHDSIYKLPDAITKARDLMDVVDDVEVLANHTTEYVSVVFRRAAAASPMELASALNDGERGLDGDVQHLQNSAATAADMREPFKSAWLKMLQFAGDAPRE
ncbi:MAG TPA: hypothetical protein VN806_05450, partial [Caulobacteraceae bacterium]|nr:hypothetical protein [Caulobacteraceae bacterium]